MLPSRAAWRRGDRNTVAGGGVGGGSRVRTEREGLQDKLCIKTRGGHGVSRRGEGGGGGGQRGALPG